MDKMRCCRLVPPQCTIYSITVFCCLKKKPKTFPVTSLCLCLADGEKGPLTIHDDNLCRICMDATIDCVLLECGHMVTCTKCGKRMNECPICRQYVVRAVHVFKS